jgi:hypothetical protein
LRNPSVSGCKTKNTCRDARTRHTAGALVGTPIVLQDHHTGEKLPSSPRTPRLQSQVYHKESQSQNLAYSFYERGRSLTPNGPARESGCSSSKNALGAGSTTMGDHLRDAPDPRSVASRPRTVDGSACASRYRTRATCPVQSCGGSGRRGSFSWRWNSGRMAS